MSSRVTSLNIISPDAEEVYFGTVTRCVDLHRASSLDDKLGFNPAFAHILV